MHLLISHRPLAASINGGSLVESVANGTSVQVTSLSMTVIGGYPPYTYSWTDDMAGVSVQVSSTATPILQASGTDFSHDGTIVAVVTDAAGNSVTSSAIAAISQGSP